MSRSRLGTYFFFQLFLTALNFLVLLYQSHLIVEFLLQFLLSVGGVFHYFRGLCTS